MNPRDLSNETVVARLGTETEKASDATLLTGQAANSSMRRREERTLPARLMTPPVPPPPPHFDDYKSIIGQAQIDAVRYLAKDLKGRSIKMVNSTAVGGGVAEMLNRLVPLLSELEVPTQWDVITGGSDFFEVTKAFHNAL